MIPAFDEIDSPKLLKQLPEDTLKQYADWLRNFLIEIIAENGGHFAANLGVVELTVALHYLYNAPDDILIWDVGHQSYAHKILTGRKKTIHSLRKSGGLSGFPKRSESIFDAFGTAHSSTSISAALGFAVAAKQKGLDRSHIAIIGDGAMSSGQAFEALNNAGVSDLDITIIINDNQIGIDPSQGALGEYLEQLEHKDENIFTDFGFQYFGPLNGHNLQELLPVLRHAKAIKGPKLIHVRTVKGKGYAPAEAEQTKWHSTSKFDKVSGKNSAINNGKVKYQDVFGKTLLELAEKNKDIVAVSPAMISGSSLHFMQDKFPDRVFDVGIAEQHAVTFSAGLAAAGLIPFCCIYSTFLQRAYDQLIHDVALQDLHVIFALDRSGLVGEDGPTHHGVFDVAFLQTIPNLTILSPRNQLELRNALYTAVYAISGPVIVRYPRGQADEEYFTETFNKLEYGKSEYLKKSGKEIVVLSYGSISKQCTEALKDSDISHVDLRYLKPLDTALLHELFNSAKHIFVVEEAQEIGGIAATISQLAFKSGSTTRVHSIGLKDKFASQGSMNELYKEEGLDAVHIREKIDAICKNSE